MPSSLPPKRESRRLIPTGYGSMKRSLSATSISQCQVITWRRSSRSWRGSKVLGWWRLKSLKRRPASCTLRPASSSIRATDSWNRATTRSRSLKLPPRSWPTTWPKNLVWRNTTRAPTTKNDLRRVPRVHEYSKLVNTNQTAISSSCIDPRPEEIKQSGFVRDKPPHLEQATREVSVMHKLLI